MTKLEEKIVKLLSDRPEQEFYAEEIVRKIKCSKASASQLLKKLSCERMTIKKELGHMKLYRINLRHPEIKSFKINQAIKELKPLLTRLEPMARQVILFGSASRGEQTFNSDLDIFILTKEKNKVRAIIKKAKATWPVKAVIKSAGQWAELEVKEPEFYREVKSGIILYENYPRA